MNINVHPEAKKNIIARADELASSMGPIDIRESRERRFQPDLHVSTTIDKSDLIGEPSMKLVDSFGRVYQMYFVDSNMTIGLSQKDYEEFTKLVNSLHRNREIGDKATWQFVEAVSFDWLKYRYRKSTNLDVIQYIESELRDKVKDYIVYMPIAGTSIESTIRVGEVEIVPITLDLIEEWKSACPAPEGQEEEVERLWARKQKMFQGHAATKFRTLAEQSRAQERALVASEKSVAMLRLFSVGIAIPEVPSPCVLMGKEHIQKAEWILTSPGGISLSEHILDKHYQRWIIDNQFLAQIMSQGMPYFDELLKEAGPSEFQTSLLNSLLIYSKGTLQKTPEDKLVYLFSAIESFLLRNSNEPIQQNVGERIAFVISKDSQKRIETVKLVKSAYSMRSNFIHHANSAEDIKVIQHFMMAVNTFFMIMVKNHSRLKNKQELFDWIDNQKFS